MLADESLLFRHSSFARAIIVRPPNGLRYMSAPSSTYKIQHARFSFGATEAFAIAMTPFPPPNFLYLASGNPIPILPPTGGLVNTTMLSKPFLGPTSALRPINLELIRLNDNLAPVGYIPGLQRSPQEQ
jgi:hypothetical protein